MLASFVGFHLAAGFNRLYLFFEEGEDDPDLAALRKNKTILDLYQDGGCLLDHRVVIVPYGPALDQERREACEFWWERHAPHLGSEIQARQNLNTLVALQRARADGLAWLLHIDSDEAFVCDRPIGLHFTALTAFGLEQVHYINREMQLECDAVVDPFVEATLFKRNPLESGGVLPFHAYQDGKAAVNVAAAFECNARPAGSISFTGFAPGKSRTFNPEQARVLHYPYASEQQFALKYAWRREEKWNTHPFHRRCLQAAAADAQGGLSGADTATAALFREVVATPETCCDLLRRGACVRDFSVQNALSSLQQASETC